MTRGATCAYCGRPVTSRATVCACGAPPPAGDVARNLSGTTSRFDHASIAADAVRKLGGYGIPLDYSFASVGALDAFLDMTLGADGFGDVDSTPSHRTAILLYGSYLGEVLRRTFGGAWEDDPDASDEIAGARVVLPSAIAVRPLQRMRVRLESGASYGLLRYLDATLDLIETKEPSSNADAWASFADALLRAGQPQAAMRLVERGLSLAPHHAGAENLLERCLVALGKTPRAAGGVAPRLPTDVAVPPLAPPIPAPARRASAEPVAVDLELLAAPAGLMSTPPDEDLAATLPDAEPPVAPAAAVEPPLAHASDVDIIIVEEHEDEREIEGARADEDDEMPTIPAPPPDPVPARPEQATLRDPSVPPARLEAPTLRDPSVPPARPEQATLRDPSVPPARLEEPTLRDRSVPPARPEEPTLREETPRPVSIPPRAEQPTLHDEHEPTLETELSAAASPPPAARVQPAYGAEKDEEDGAVELSAPVPSGFGSTPELAADLCALAIAGDAASIDATLAENAALLGGALVDDLADWAQTAARDADPEARRDACEAVCLLSDRLHASGTPGARRTAVELLTRCARSLGPVVPVPRRASLSAQLATLLSAGGLHDDARAVLDTALGGLDARAEPVAWAELSLTQARVLLSRGGVRKDDVEAAILALGRALRPISKETHPEVWGAVQLSLGQALRIRMTGDKQRNVDEAAAAFAHAAGALAQGTSSWGLAQQGIGVCLITTLRGDRDGNVEAGIAALTASLAALPPGTDAARSHYNLGLAYQRRKLGARADNLARAAEHYRLGMGGTGSTGERQSAAENLDAAERELRKIRTP